MKNQKRKTLSHKVNSSMSFTLQGVAKPEKL
jgi:hypothetical protein